jgi:repressor LexA
MPPGEMRERVFDYVRARLLAGEPPTIREVMRAHGLTAVETARAHLEALVAEGRLVKNVGHARGYRLPATSAVRPARPVPLLGRVQAGGLAAAIQVPDGYLWSEAAGAAVPVPVEDELFALRVRGDSMSGAGILDGDVVIVRRQPAARAGDIVVALVGDEATVKTLRFQRGRPVLVPENPAYATIVPDELTVLGKVIELRRRLG